MAATDLSCFLSLEKIQEGEPLMAETDLSCFSSQENNGKDPRRTFDGSNRPFMFLKPGKQSKRSKKENI